MLALPYLPQLFKEVASPSFDTLSHMISSSKLTLRLRFAAALLVRFIRSFSGLSYACQPAIGLSLLAEF
jgi:hypothetical protein